MVISSEDVLSGKKGLPIGHLHVEVQSYNTRPRVTHRCGTYETPLLGFDEFGFVQVNEDYCPLDAADRQGTVIAVENEDVSSHLTPPAAIA
jgi:hypothetical protein